MKKKIALYMVLAAFVIVTGVFLVLYNKPHRSIKDEEAAFKLTASELIDAFSEDEGRANSLYTGKVIEVKGILKDMIRNDSTLILLLGDSSRMMGISCYLEKSQIARSEKLTRGDSIAVKGVCNGMLLDVVLDKGILVKDE